MREASDEPAPNTTTENLPASLQNASQRLKVVRHRQRRELYAHGHALIRQQRPAFWFSPWT